MSRSQRRRASCPTPDSNDLYTLDTEELEDDNDPLAGVGTGRKKQPMNRRQQFYRQHVTSGNVARTPMFRAALGSAMLLIMVIISCFSVLTTQNLVAGGDGSGVVMRWSVFMQPLDLMQGAYAGKEAVAIIVSWGLFVLYLIVGAFEVITPDNKGEDKLFKTVCYGLLFIDGIATYEYLHILPWLYQVLFTALVPVAIGFLGKYGLTMVLSAIADYVKASKEA